MANDIPSTMSAARLHVVGSDRELRLDTVAIPGVGEDDVLVQIEAAGINPLDWKIRSGDRPAPASMMLGHDLVGRVLVIGAKVGDRFAVGERVYAMANEGAFAQYALVPAMALAPAPVHLDAPTAAAVPMGALTAWKGLLEMAKLKKVDRVLIHGAGGSVGGEAVQLAKHLGAWVAATASGDDLARVRAWGVDLLIDHRTERFDEVVARAGGVDVVLDVLGGETRERSWSILREGGRMTSTLGSTVPPPAAAARGIHGTPAWGTSPDGARLAAIAKLFDERALTIAPPKRFPLDQIAAAMDAAESGHVGKVVIEMGEGA